MDLSILPPLIPKYFWVALLLLMVIHFKSFLTHCASQYKHVHSVGPTVYHLFTYCIFLPLDPSHRGQLQLQCSLSLHQNLSAPSLCVSLYSIFLYFYPALQFLKTLTFLWALLLFSLLGPWTDPSLSMCAALFVLSSDNPLEPLSWSNLDSSALFLFQRAELRVQGLFYCWYVSHFEGQIHSLWEKKCVFLRPQVCSCGELLLCVPPFA